MTKTPLPQKTQEKMTSWRNGYSCFPQDYIDFHEGLARAALGTLENAGYSIRSTFMSSDGWCDGMKALTVVVERDGKLSNLQWHDGNQEFFIKTGSGASPLRL